MSASSIPADASRARPEDALPVARTRADLRARVADWRAQGLSVALVPTMGALHAGHLALVDHARTRADRVVASVFVNPTQFAPHEDLARYPRREAQDARLLADAGCHALYLPGVADIYPDGFATSIHVAGVSAPLEGEARPTHFQGVATIVAKLLIQVTPDVAVFGEKDWQQLCVVRRLAADLDLPTEIAGVATVREADGLALSSRNAYLSAADRAAAPALKRALDALCADVRAGADVGTAEAAAVASLQAAGFSRVDYLTLRDAETLSAWTPGRPGRALGAAVIGATRLIDNRALDA